MVQGWKLSSLNKLQGHSTIPVRLFTNPSKEAVYRTDNRENLCTTCLSNRSRGVQCTKASLPSQISSLGTQQKISSPCHCRFFRYVLMPGRSGFSFSTDGADYPTAFRVFYTPPENTVFSLALTRHASTHRTRQ